MPAKRQAPKRRGTQVVRKQREQARAESTARQRQNQKKGDKKGGNKKGGDKKRKKGKRAQPQELALWPLPAWAEPSAIEVAGRELLATVRSVRNVWASAPRRDVVAIVAAGLGAAARPLLTYGSQRLSQRAGSLAAAWPGMVTPEARRANSSVALSPPSAAEPAIAQPSPLPREETYADEPMLPVPRVLPFVVMKRDSPRFRDHYGHWWFEIDGVESYGWWADHCPFTLRDMIVGARGVLNGVGGTCRGGTLTTDPRHGDESDHSFSPTLLVPKTDRQVRDEIRAFARSYSGAWGWRWWWSKERMTDCHSFQDDLFEAIGLEEGPEHVYTRGPGCPFMYPFRHAAWRLQDGIAALRRWRHGLCCGRT